MQNNLLDLFRNRQVVCLFFFFTFIIISSPVYVISLSFYTGNVMIALYAWLCPVTYIRSITGVTNKKWYWLRVVNEVQQQSCNFISFKN